MGRGRFFDHCNLDRGLSIPPGLDWQLESERGLDQRGYTNRAGLDATPQSRRWSEHLGTMAPRSSTVCDCHRHNLSNCGGDQERDCSIISSPCRRPRSHTRLLFACYPLLMAEARSSGSRYYSSPLNSIWFVTRGEILRELRSSAEKSQTKARSE